MTRSRYTVNLETVRKRGWTYSDHRTAHHEAGHAVIGRVLGLDGGLVTKSRNTVTESPVTGARCFARARAPWKNTSSCAWQGGRPSACSASTTKTTK